MRVLPHQLCSRRAYASQVATSIPAFRRPCTPPAGFWAAPGFASLAPFSNDRTSALRQNSSAQPRPAKKVRLKPLATACGIQNEAGLAAFNAIETEFASKFEGCTLEEVRYDSKVETRHLDEMLEHGQKGKGDLIVVLSEFTTDWRAADEGFSPNDRYEGWQWILTRPSQDAPWKIVDWGY